MGVNDMDKFYARPEQLWLEQRVIAEKRFGNWRNARLYEMTSNGPDAKIIAPVIGQPNEEQWSLSRNFD